MQELKELLREHGVEDVSQVKRACLESDGHISVVRFDKKSTTASE